MNERDATEETDDTEGQTYWRNVSDGVEDDTDDNIVRPGHSVPPAANRGKDGEFQDLDRTHRWSESRDD